MPKLAAVIYDVRTHSPLILRTLTSSAHERAATIDAVAAFAHHCDATSSIARSPVHVAALWAGPPYVAYALIARRLRVIVFFTAGTGVASLDVHDALTSLAAAVDVRAAALIARDAAALGTVYAEAGLILNGAHAAAGHAAPTATASDDSATGSGVSRGKRGSFLRSLVRPRARREGSESEEAPSAPLPEAPQTAVLRLPDEVFAFSDFGAPLAQRAGDIAWVARLLRGYEPPKTQPLPAALERATSFKALPPPEPAPAPPPATDTARTRAEPPRPPPETPPYSTQSVPSVPSVPSVAPAPSVPSLPSPPSAPSVPSAPSDASSAAVLAAFAPTPRSSAAAPQLPAPVPQPHSDIPHQLGGEEDDFDISAFGRVQDPATTANAPHPEPSSSSLPPSSSDVTATAPATAPATATDTASAIRLRMNEFANSMQAGNYSLALQQVTRTLTSLSSLTPPPSREIATCASYLLALKILVSVCTLEASSATLAPVPSAVAQKMRLAVQQALLTMFLAESKNLLPRHAAAGRKMAVDKNMAVGNFGMAARWLRTLIDDAPVPAKGALQQRLALCVQNGELNTNMPPTKFMCFLSLAVIQEAPLKCGFCPAVFAPGAGAVVGGKCAVCHCGNVGL